MLIIMSCNVSYNSFGVRREGYTFGLKGHFGLRQRQHWGSNLGAISNGIWSFLTPLIVKLSNIKCVVLDYNFIDSSLVKCSNIFSIPFLIKLSSLLLVTS